MKGGHDMMTRAAVESGSESREAVLIARAVAVNEYYSISGREFPDEILQMLRSQARSLGRIAHNAFRREVGSCGLQGILPSAAAPRIMEILFSARDRERFEDVITISRVVDMRLRGYAVSSISRITWEFEDRLLTSPDTLRAKIAEMGLDFASVRRSFGRLKRFLHEGAGPDYAEKSFMRDHERRIARLEPDMHGELSSPQSRDEIVTEYRDACFMRTVLFKRLRSQKVWDLNQAHAIVRDILSYDQRARELLKLLKQKKRVKTEGIASDEVTVRRTALLIAAKFLRDDAMDAVDNVRSALEKRAEEYEAHAEVLLAL